LARARNIKPGFFKNEVLAELTPLTRLLFAGLWCLADREGRLEDRPKRIKADIFPYDNCNVDKKLNHLRDKGFVLRYQVDGEGYIQVLNFNKHQNPHIKEQASLIPAPDIHHANTMQTPDKHGSCPADSLSLDSLSSDSLNPITDSLSSSPVGSGWGNKPFKVGPEMFDHFWRAYPKKKSKSDAVKAWNKLKIDNLLYTLIMNKLEDAKKSHDWTKDNGQFIPYPATWLNKKMWEDEYSTEIEQVPKGWNGIKQWANRKGVEIE
jgi:hypothetical protein